MSGVLNMVQDRKAYFQSLKDSDPTAYIKKFGESTSRLANQLGVGTNKSTATIGAGLGANRTSSERTARSQADRDNKHHFEDQRQGERQIGQIKTLGYDLGNDLDSLKNVLGGLLTQLLDSNKKLNRTLQQSLGGGGLLDLLGAGDGRRRRGRPGAPGRGRGRGRPQGPNTNTGLGAGRAQPPRLPGRAPPPLPPAPSTTAFGRLGDAARSARGVGSNALGWISSKATSVASSVRSAPIGSTLGRAGAIGAVAAGGIGAYNALKDETKTDGEKAQAVANVAGGTAGALAMGAGGAKLGAVIGTAIMPGIGTAIGGAIGGIGGGALGYFGGEAIVDKIGGAISGAVESSGVGDHIGRGVSVFMAPFSKDARAALKSDWNNNLMPALNATVTPLKDSFLSFGASFASTMGNLRDGLVNAFDALPKGMQDAITATSSVLTAPVRSVMGGLRAVAGRVEASGSFGAGIVRAGRAVNDRVASALPEGAARQLGFIAAKYESGGRGVSTVSTGRGDHGGVSYGKHQLATKNGSMAAFLNSAQGRAYASQFAGLAPGSAAFTEKYKQVAAADEAGFAAAQQQYIVATHYNPQAQRINRQIGLDVNARGSAVQEAVMSTSVQYGGGTNTIINALKGKDTSTMSDADIVNAIQDYKQANVGTNFRSSSDQVREGVSSRIERERADLLALAAEAPKTGTPATQFAGVTGSVDTTAAVVPAPTPAPAPTVTTGPAQFAGVSGSVETTAAVSSVAVSPGSSDSAGVATAQWAAPAQQVSPTAPPEATPVAVVSTPAPPTSTASSGGARTAAASNPGTVASSGLSIDSIPVFVPDPALASVLFGKV